MEFDFAVKLDENLQFESTRYLFELYHENSKLWTQLDSFGRVRSVAESPTERYVTSRGFKQFVDAPFVELPSPLVARSQAFNDVVKARRSRRALTGRITLQELGTLLHDALGCTAIVEIPDEELLHALRAWPSAGGLYPIDVYVAAVSVDGLDPGLYHFNPIREGLERLPSRSIADIVADCFFYQDFAVTASASLLLVGCFGRTAAKYGERAYRLSLLDAGHAAQNILLCAEHLRLGACAVAGFHDDQLAEALALDGISEAVLHSVMLGRLTDDD